MKPSLVIPLLATTLARASYPGEPNKDVLKRTKENTNSTAKAGAACSLNRGQPPGDLTQCPNNSLFKTWRPKARFIAPNGWMNDPMGLFQRSDGVIHVGYQAHLNHVQWGNISQGAAYSKDFVYWHDFGSWESPLTMWPSEIYDIRGVFDGSIIDKGWQGHPTILYTSTHPGQLGSAANPPEKVGAETQSIAYTTDGGASWIKLNFGSEGNPVIYNWPANGLTGFRDPWIFKSTILTKLLGNSSSATGDNFLTISGGLRQDSVANQADAGGRLFLYRQTTQGEVRGWTYLGELLKTGLRAEFSAWSGNYGVNYETANVQRLNPSGLAHDDGTDPDAVDVIGFGTEAGRSSHDGHWPLWTAVSYSKTSTGSISAKINYSGVVDWGRAYAYFGFPVDNSRQVLVGWVYEDDGSGALGRQLGYNGAFTLYRDAFVLITRNVDPSTPDLNSPSSWGVRKEANGSTSTITIGQKVVKTIKDAYKGASTVSSHTARQVVTVQSGYTPLKTQPKSSHYALFGKFKVADGAVAGFRVLASNDEYTDILYDVASETLRVLRGKSSLIKSFGTDTEEAKHRLWRTKASGSSTFDRQTLNLEVYVDGSIVEVYANDVTVITTRAYPWLAASIGAGFLNTGSGAVQASEVELWDGLLNAWPDRPNDTSKPLYNDGPLPNDAWGVWGGI